MSPSGAERFAETIAKSVSMSGIALHSGIESTITFKPHYNRGIFFIYNGERMEALAENVTETTRGTTLGKISVVEHVLSAISGLGIDSLEIELSQPEPPAADGSAYPFAKLLTDAGRKSLEFKKSYLEIKTPIKLIDGEASIEALPFDSIEVSAEIDFPGIGNQQYTYSENYINEISKARTFGYLEELEELKKRGLAKGASLETALALDKNGYINAPRYENEPVRHKILDLIGDLSLVGMPIRAKIISRKSGHKLNVMLAKKLRGIN